MADVSNVDKRFDKDFRNVEEAMEEAKGAHQFVETTSQAVHDTREHYHRLATSFDEAARRVD